MKYAKKFLTMLLVLAMVMSLSVTAFAAIGDNGGTSKSKTATPLNGMFSQVTLSLPAEAEKHAVDVVFVMDGSTSTDEDDLAAAAADLLTELQAMSSTVTVKAGVVVFGGRQPILHNSGLLELNAETLDTLRYVITDKNYDGMKDEVGSLRSGSNLQAGVNAGRALLNGSSTANSDQYLILLTDGAARMWQDDAGNALSQTYIATLDSPDKIFWNSNSDWLDVRYKVTAEYTPVCPTFADTWSAGQNGVTIGAYAMTEAQKNAASATDEGVASYETVKEGKYYTTYEAAAYYAATSIKAAVSEANVYLISYPYHDDTNYGQYIETFKAWLAANGVTRYDNGALDASAIFAAVKKDIVQLVDADSRVVDIIGEDFDLYIAENADLSTAFRITVGGSQLTGMMEDGVAYFGDDANPKQFSIAYDKTDTLEETITWNIHVPVTVDRPVQLTYTVELVNIPEKSAENIPTNESATLYPVGSDGTGGTSELFEVPTVSYKVSAPGMEKKIVLGEKLVDSDTIAAGEVVKFQLSSNVPDTLLNYLEIEDKTPSADAPAVMSFDDAENSGTYKLAFHDVMDSNLVLDEGSIVVTINGNKVDSSLYEVLVGENIKDGCTFEVVMNLVELYEKEYFSQEDFGSAKIIVTYTAETNGLKPGTYENTAWVEYEGGETAKDTVTVKTFGIKIFKYDQATAAGEGNDWNATGLAGAKFELKNSSGTVITEVISDKDGYAYISGLDVGVYTLVETQAPEGYIGSKESLTVTITENTDAGYVSVKFANSEIPHTGGTGTAMYTIAGSAILLTALGLFVVTRRRKEEA